MPYRGVYAKGEKFAAYVGHEGKRIGLGSFATELEAAQAYDAKAFELLGEKAQLNFPRADNQVMNVDLSLLKTEIVDKVREKISQDTVTAYAEIADVLPAGDAFFDGTDYWLADGGHRYRALQEAGKKAMAVIVHLGTKREASLFAAGSNASHGLARSPGDKSRSVQLLLSDDEWYGRSDKWLAEAAKVSNHFVAKVRESFAKTNPKAEEPATRTDKRGNKQPAKKKAKVKAEEPEEPEEKAKPKERPTPNGKPKFNDAEVDGLVGKLVRSFDERAEALGKTAGYEECVEAMGKVVTAWRKWRS